MAFNNTIPHFDLICFITIFVCHVIWDKYDMRSRISNIMFFVPISVCHVIWDKCEIRSRISNNHSYVLFQVSIYVNVLWLHTYPIFSYQYICTFFYFTQKRAQCGLPSMVSGVRVVSARRDHQVVLACTKVEAIQLLAWDSSSSDFSP